MYLSYQIATPDVEIRPSVTSYQGDFETSVKELKSYGYKWLELMTRDPKELNQENIKKIIEDNGMEVSMVCTGECFGQDKLRLATTDEQLRNRAIERTKSMIDFASYLGAGVNIGRLRGHYEDGVPKEVTDKLAVDVCRELSDYAKEKNVVIVLEPVTQLQTNFINSTSEGIELVNKVNKDNFQIMIDIYHSNIEDRDIYEAIKSAKGILGHMHFADNNRRIPGTCGFDFNKIVETLKEIGFTKAISIEMFQIPDQKTCAIESFNYLNPIIERVKK